MSDWGCDLNIGRRRLGAAAERCRSFCWELCWGSWPCWGYLRIFGALAVLSSLSCRNLSWDKCEQGSSSSLPQEVLEVEHKPSVEGRATSARMEAAAELLFPMEMTSCGAVITSCWQACCSWRWITREF